MNMDEMLKDAASHNDSDIGEDEQQCVTIEVEMDDGLQADGLNVIESGAFPEMTSTQDDEGRISRPSREPVDRTSLELKLDALIEEMRVELAAEHTAVGESPGHAVHVAGFCAPTSIETREMEAPKVVVISETDPREELTEVGRRAPNDESWIFDGVEEDGPTNPVLPLPQTSTNAPISKKPPPERKTGRAALAISFAMLGVFVPWFVMAHKTPPAQLIAANQSLPLREGGTSNQETQNQYAAPPALTAAASADVEGNQSATPNPPMAANNGNSGNENVIPLRSRNQSSRKNKAVVIPRPAGRAWPGQSPRNNKVPPEAPLEPKRDF